MAASVDSPPPSHINEGAGFMGSASPPSLAASPLFSPSSDRRFWSSLRCRVDALLENRDRGAAGETERSERMKADSMLLLRGFDSVAHTLSQLSDNIDNALQGARDLAKPPTLTAIFHSNLKKSSDECSDIKQHSGEHEEEEEEEKKKALKRKFDSSNCSEEGDSKEENAPSPKLAKLKKAKNLAVSMATKAASLARELKSMKSDLCFTQERCALLEEENRRLRDGFSKGIRPEEDDLVRLQLETLLAEKSRLANENANLIRENQCLSQLVAYHQLTSQDLSESYEQVMRGMCLDFSSPPPPIAEDETEDVDDGAPATPLDGVFSFSTCLDESFQQDEH
ncbi:uncharacterized protein LOC115756933 [Rhodamnia argentea]|uniref:Uncharacterized protein LOC115756933 n=1 Tax=Rhodamnia argentea TaxID=178133 RepID=A0A8B8R080_9MYRT|nr:uncharacterized protein LOC115756933 [Rhodamnia argentea]